MQRTIVLDVVQSAYDPLEGFNIPALPALTPDSPVVLIGIPQAPGGSRRFVAEP